MKRILSYLSILCLLLVSHSSFAKQGLLFNVSAAGSLLSITTTIPNHTYPQAGIKINTPGYHLTSSGVDCTPSSTGYCLFSVNALTPTTLSISGPSGKVSITLCLSGKGPLSCQKYSGSIIRTAISYVSDVGNNTILKCRVKENGDLVDCVDAGNTGVPVQVPLGIVLNNSATMAYIVLADSNNVLKCPVGSDGSLGSCSSSGNTGIPFVHPINIALNKAGTLAYITNQFNNSVSICPINVNGGFGKCRASGNTGMAFDSPVGIALNHNGDFAYITNQAGLTLIVKCPIKSNGAFGSCSSTGASFTKPDNLVLNRGNTLAYVTDSGLQRVYQCAIKANGDLASCKNSGNTLSPIAAGIILNKAEDTAYIGNGSGNIVKCPIGLNGTLGPCISAGGSGFNFPLYLFLLESSTSW